MKVVNIQKYEKGDNLGKGSFGFIYVLKDPENSNKYVAKEIRCKSDQKKMELRIKDFIQELNSYSKLDNPAILKFYGYSPINISDRKCPILILEFCENSSLDKKIKSLNFSATSRYICLLGIAIGMKYLHSQGIVHRDLKTLNILLDKNFYPKICDFGSSAISNVNLDHFHMIDIVGTVLYSAPEILRSEVYSYKVDVFSFSFVAYELLTSNDLFDFKVYNNRYKISTAIKRGKRPNLSNIHDKKIQNFLQKCWSEKPNERPSFHQIVQELLNKRYRKYFKVNEYEVSKYLKLFDEKLLNPNLYKEFQYKNDEIYCIGIFDLLVLVIFSLWISFDYKNSMPNKKKNEKMSVFIYDGFPIEHKYYIKRGYSMDDLKKLVEKGDSDAMGVYGMILYNQKGTVASKRKAINYIKKSAKLGNNIAMLNYGILLYEGKFIAQDKVKACQYFKMSADLGNIEAMQYYANMRIKGDGVPIFIKDAIYYFKKSADLGNIKSMFSYGSMLMTEEYIKNYTAAIRYFKKAADLGCVYSMNNYASLVLDGKGKSADKKEAAKYFKMAADKGDSFLKYRYGEILLEENNKKEAAYYLKQSADLGNDKSMLIYSDMLLNGDGVEADLNEAIIYLKKAIEKGNLEAMVKYSKMYFVGKVNQISKEEAIKYLRISAELGNEESLYEYGKMLVEEFHVEKDKIEGLKYLKMSSNLGNKDAMLKYGIILMESESFLDRKEAIQYIKKSMDLGNSDAAIVYNKYINNTNLINKTQQINNLKIFADNGDIDSMYLYGVLLLNGDGVEINKKEAAKYFKNSSEKGNINS